MQDEIAAGAANAFQRKEHGVARVSLELRVQWDPQDSKGQAELLDQRVKEEPKDYPDHLGQKATRALWEFQGSKVPMAFLVIVGSRVTGVCLDWMVVMAPLEMKVYRGLMVFLAQLDHQVFQVLKVKKVNHPIYKVELKDLREMMEQTALMGFLDHVDHLDPLD